MAAPGARRLTFTGLMAVPDDFGRLRVLLVERAADGAPDGSWAMLARELPRGGAEAKPKSYSVPYDLREEGADADGVRGVVRVTVPKRYRAHWGKVAEGLRGQEVRVEVTVRPFTFQLDPESPALAPERTTAAGVALDLAMLGPRGSEAAPKAPRVEKGGAQRLAPGEAPPEGAPYI